MKIVKIHIHQLCGWLRIGVIFRNLLAELIIPHSRGVDSRKFVDRNGGCLCLSS